MSKSSFAVWQVLLLTGNYSIHHCKRASVSTQRAETSHQLDEWTSRQPRWTIPATEKPTWSASWHICWPADSHRDCLVSVINEARGPVKVFRRCSRPALISCRWLAISLSPHPIIYHTDSRSEKQATYAHAHLRVETSIYLSVSVDCGMAGLRLPSPGSLAGN